jgi:beta-glucanase (GH16 family)
VRASGVVLSAALVGSVLLSGLSSGAPVLAAKPADAASTCTGVLVARGDGSVAALATDAASTGCAASIYHGSLAGSHLNAPIIGVAALPGGNGYWLLGSDGGVFSYGDTNFYGSTGGIHLNSPVVGMAPTPDGEGYWLVASDGGVFAFGDAKFWGSAGNLKLNKPVVGMAADEATGGYWLVASDGGVFAYNAPFLGSMGGKTLNAPMRFMTGTPDYGGYRLVASDGGVFDYGDAQYYGSAVGPGSSGWSALATTPDNAGYWLFGAGGSGGSPSDKSFGDAAPTLTFAAGDSSSTAAVVSATTVSFAVTPPPTTTSTTTTTTTATVPSESNCSGTVPLGIPGNWTCTFDDEFSGTALDTQNWLVQQTANSGFVTGSGSAAACYMDSPDNVSVSGGYLHLTITQSTTPFTCSDPDSSFSTEYSAGMVSTDNLFSQTYGAFEVNAELPPSIITGLQETLWLYPQNLTYGAWPASGEIDFAEFYSEFPALDVPFIHYNPASGGAGDTALCPMDPTTFNTYGVDWQPGSIKIYVNGVECFNDTPDPASPLTSPQPFDQPFFIALTQAIGGGTNAPLAGLTSFPETTLIDWVRAWH